MTKAELSKRVMRTIAIDRRRPHLFRDQNGNAPMMIVLPNEYVGEVFDRAQKLSSAGGFNIIVAFAKHFEVMTYDGAVNPEFDMEISGDMSMGMLGIKMDQNPGKCIRINVRGQSVDVPSAASFAYA